MSNRDAKPQRTRIDWDAAKARYVELGPSERSFERIAKEFRVSSVSVRKWARRGGWVAAAAKADNDAAAKGLRRAVRTRADRVQKVLGIVDAALDGFDANLDAKIAEAKLSDLPALQKLAELLEGHATDRVDIRKVQPVIVAFVTRMAGLVPEGRQEEFASHLDWLEGELLAIEAPAEPGA